MTAIGNFDGCHLGHARLIETLLEAGKSLSLPTTVLTFHPHPVEVLNPGKTLECLSTSSEKLRLLESLGIELVLVATFDRALAQLSPDDFFQQYLQGGLRAKSLHVGSNFCFGKNRAGDINYLETLSKSAGVKLRVTPQFQIDGERVSSSLIRQLISRGSVARASKLLGRHYSISGGVVRGEGRGRKLGFRTANLGYPFGKVLPQTGVYVTQTTWQREVFQSVTNVGVKPTFQQTDRRVVIETHLLDFQSQLYDENIQVAFLERIREERKFGSVDELKQGIEGDIRFAERYFSKPKP